jgi:hypothetical protein
VTPIVDSGRTELSTRVLAPGRASEGTRDEPGQKSTIGKGPLRARGIRGPQMKLAETDKEDDRAAARRIPAVLAVVGLDLRRDEDRGSVMTSTDGLRALLENENRAPGRSRA